MNLRRFDEGIAASRTAADLDPGWSAPDIVHGISLASSGHAKEAELTCPYCGEDVELVVDEGGRPDQSYVEDCPVCCRPWQVTVAGDDESVWNAMLRTSDE